MEVRISLPNYDESLRTNDDVDDIIDRYSKTVYRLAFAQTKNRNDADEVFQEVFLRYIRKKPSFESSEHEKAWFLRVTINCCKNIWMSRKKAQSEQLDDNIAWESEEEIRLDRYLNALPKDYRTVIHLFYYEDLSTAEISKVLDRKESTVRVQLTRARRLLRDMMEGEDFSDR
jgi:RNA polymerase sigma-70 factor (ECF subfamily)